MKNVEEYDYIFYIGKFHPFHNGHLQACHQALKISKNLIVLIGSKNMAPNINYPFTFEDRRKIIAETLCPIYRNRIKIEGLRDYFYSANDSLWIDQIVNTIQSITDSKKIAIIGHEKDETSYYIQVLSKVLNIDFVPVKIKNTPVLNATDIRRDWIRGIVPQSNLVPEPVTRFLEEYDIEEWKRLVTESVKVEKGKKDYPGTSVAADSIVTCAGKILLGIRKGEVGNGQIAFPGGFVSDKDIHLLDTSIRELREETKLKVAEPILRGSLQNSKLYSHKLRDVRGRVISEAFHFDLKMDPKKGLPPIKANDDLKEVFWKSISWFRDNPTLVFADHWEIFEDLIGF